MTAALAIHNARLYEQAQKEINERMMIEHDLRASDERFRKVFNNNNIAISIVTLEDGIFLEANNTFWQVSGLSPETTLGHSALEFNMWEHPEDRATFVRELLEKGSLQNVEVNFAAENRPNNPKVDEDELCRIESLYLVLTAQEPAPSSPGFKLLKTAQ